MPKFTLNLNCPDHLKISAPCASIVAHLTINYPVNRWSRFANWQKSASTLSRTGWAELVVAVEQFRKDSGHGPRYSGHGPIDGRNGPNDEGHVWTKNDALMFWLRTKRSNLSTSSHCIGTYLQWLSSGSHWLNFPIGDQCMGILKPSVQFEW